MKIVGRKPTGVLKALLRAPIWIYRARLGRLLGHRFVYLAHTGRRSGLRREVVVEVVRYDAAVPEVVVVAAWGKNPDWYANLRAAPALEVRIAGQRWEHPEHRFLDGAGTLAVLRAYGTAHPRAWRRLAPVLGFPADLDDPRWPDLAREVHAVAFRPAGVRCPR